MYGARSDLGLFEGPSDNNGATIVTGACAGLFLAAIMVVSVLGITSGKTSLVAGGAMLGIAATVSMAVVMITTLSNIGSSHRIGIGTGGAELSWRPGLSRRSVSFDWNELASVHLFGPSNGGRKLFLQFNDGHGVTYPLQVWGRPHPRWLRQFLVAAQNGGVEVKVDFGPVTAPELTDARALR